MVKIIHSTEGQPLLILKEMLSQAVDEITIFSPYIRVDTLEELDLSVNKKTSIVTTLRIDDLWTGSSDINLYPYSRDKNFKIFINNNIHLKAYIRDWNNCMFGSSNLSQRGMGTTNKYNYELNGVVTKFGVETIIYFKKIIAESRLMDDFLYDAVKVKYDSLPDRFRIEDIDISVVGSDRDYLISSLPMTKDIAQLYELIKTGFKSESQEEIDCAIHDSILFKIPLDASFEEFTKHLKRNFFASDFIKDLLSFIDQKERYFGTIKDWIQSNCTDVPLPSKRDLTGNIQVLYQWIVFLSDGKYLIDRPKHSERIYRNKNGK